MLTGIKVGHSTQHRLLWKGEIPKTKGKEKVKALSVDGGSARIRTPLGEKSEWKQYKAIKLHEQVGMALFQNNKELINWVNKQPLIDEIVCLGDGHDGVWNIIEEIGDNKYRKEVLDWYHLIENLHKIPEKKEILFQIKSDLWNGSIDKAFKKLNQLKDEQAQKFKNYIEKHKTRIPNYKYYQQEKIAIGSGAVESLIKQISARIKIVGAQWDSNNVSQILKLRCAYLNGEIKMSIFT